MALPDGVTTATVTAGVPVTHTGGQVKAFLSIEPSAFLVHTATGTPLVDFLEDVDISAGTTGYITLPHTDQAGFQDEAGNAYTNWYYTARITYSTPSRAKTKPPKVKVFQLASGQTTVDLDTLPGGAPALPYTAPTATVTSFAGRTGAVTVQDADLPARLSSASLSATIDDKLSADAAADKTINGQRTFSSLKGLRTTTWFGIGAGVGSARNPFYMNSVVSGNTITNTLAAGGGDDYVGMQTNIKFDGGFEHLKTHAVGNMTAGSNVLTLTSGTFTSPVAVGFTAYVTGAGAGGGMPVKTKIVSITDSTHAVLAANAATTVTGAAVIFSLAADHNYAFMANDFYTTGALEGALSGINNVFGRLTELHIYTPNVALTAIKATSSELDIEASAVGTTITDAVAHEISAIRNDPNAAITNAYGLLIHGKAPSNTTNAWGLVVSDGGRTNLTGATRVGGSAPAASVPLVVQTPLGATAPALEIRDYTLTNRVFSIGNNGAIASSTYVTAFEGLGSQTNIGLQPGGYAGIGFGNSNQVYIKKVSLNVIGLDSATQGFATGYGTTAQRPANPVNGTLYTDSTLGKIIQYNGGVWKDAMGTAV